MGRARAVPGSGMIHPPSITVYPKNAQGDTPPLRVIQGPETQMDWPTSLAVHPDRGELFVANDTGDSVIVFSVDAEGDVAPIRVIQGPRTMINNPTGVTLDLKNNELWGRQLWQSRGDCVSRRCRGRCDPEARHPQRARGRPLADAQQRAYGRV